MTTSEGIEALKQAIKLAGGQAALASKINTKQQNISWWIKKSGKVPAEHAVKIELALQGAVTKSQLRPDLYPSDQHQSQ